MNNTFDINNLKNNTHSNNNFFILKNMKDFSLLVLTTNKILYILIIVE
jgi:hypothetical protein